MKVLSFSASLLTCVSLISCNSRKGNNDADFPDNFAQLPDTAQVSYVMSKATPDSVARFICYSALGKNTKSGIRNIGVATNYAYEKLKGDDLDLFSNAYDEFVSSLPLVDKMNIYAKAGTEDPQGLGYQLGLEYMQSIRENNLSPADVEKELKAFKQACKNDPETYSRFLVGFKTVLKMDQNTDVPKAIYDRFINYE